MKKSYFRVIPTTADVGLEFRGTDWNDFLDQGLLGLQTLILPKPSFQEPHPGRLDEFPFRLVSDSWETLLVNFLSEATFIIYFKKKFIKKFVIQSICPFSLRGRWICRDLAGVPTVEIKSVTYHRLKVQVSDQSLRTRVIFDI